MRKLFTALAAIAALAISAPAVAAVTLSVDSTTHKLTGASGVVVGDSVYDVTFGDGTCATIYGVCDLAHFDFATVEGASAAAQALLNQVLLDTPQGQFDTNFGLTQGCSSDGNRCGAIIAYAELIGTNFQFTEARNYAANAQDIVFGGNFPKTFNTGTFSDSYAYTFAKFTRTGSSVAAVPEPATWAMMLFGFGGIGMAMRRRKVVAYA